MYVYKCVYTCNFIYNAPYKSITYIHHFPDKQAGHNLPSYISKQTSRKVRIQALLLKSDFNLR